MSGQPDPREDSAAGRRPSAAADSLDKRPYSPPDLVEYGSVARLTAVKSGSPTDAGMPMTVCL